MLVEGGPWRGTDRDRAKSSIFNRKHRSFGGAKVWPLSLTIFSAFSWGRTDFPRIWDGPEEPMPVIRDFGTESNAETYPGVPCQDVACLLDWLDCLARFIHSFVLLHRIYSIPFYSADGTIKLNQLVQSSQPLGFRSDGIFMYSFHVRWLGNTYIHAMMLQLYRAGPLDWTCIGVARCKTNQFYSPLCTCFVDRMVGLRVTWFWFMESVTSSWIPSRRAESILANDTRTNTQVHEEIQPVYKRNVLRI
jgi:hypothetical protein